MLIAGVGLLRKYDPGYSIKEATSETQHQSGDHQNNNNAEARLHILTEFNEGVPHGSHIAKPATPCKRNWIY